MTTTKDQSISWPSKTVGGRSFNGGDPGELETSRIMTVSRTRTGTRLPHYYDVIAKGGNATTPMDAVWDTLDYNSGPRHVESIWHSPNFPGSNFTSYNDGDWLITNNIGSLIFSGLNPTQDISFCDNLARASFYKALHKLQNQFQGAVFLGELRETLHLLRHPVQSLHNLGKDFLGTLGKRKRSHPTSWKKDLGALWLEQAFGWKPLINDCKDAVKAYERLIKPEQKRVVSASAKKQYDLSSTLSGFGKTGGSAQVDGGNWFRIIAPTGFYEYHTVRYKGALIARVKGPQWQNSDLFGFEPQDWIPAAWELLPWSFLADYFTNCGDILDASITSTRDLTYVNKTAIRQTVRVKTAENAPELGNGSPSNAWTPYQWTRARSQFTAKRKVVSRTANSGVSIPDLQFNFSLTDGQLGNIAALLAQAGTIHPQDKPRKWHR
jgi:hypothetical protein